MKARSVSFAAATAAAGVLALPALIVAAPAHAAPSSLCTATYGNPNVPVQLNASTAFSATAAGEGSIRITAKTDSRSLIGYQQEVGFTWANLDTGRSGGGTSHAQRVVGPDNPVDVHAVETGPGRVTFVFSTSNTGAVNPKAVTSGQCGAETTVA